MKNIEKKLMIIGSIIILLGLAVFLYFEFTKVDLDEFGFETIATSTLSYSGDRVKFESDEYEDYSIKVSGVIYSSYNDKYYDGFYEYDKAKNMHSKERLLITDPEKTNIIEENKTSHVYQIKAYPKVELYFDVNKLASKYMEPKSNMVKSLSGNLKLIYKGKKEFGIISNFYNINVFVTAGIFIIGIMTLALGIYIWYMKRLVKKKKIEYGLNFDSDIDEYFMSISNKYEQLKSLLEKDKLKNWEATLSRIKDLRDKAIVFMRLIQQFRDTMKNIDMSKINLEIEKTKEVLDKDVSEEIKKELGNNLVQYEKLKMLYEKTQTNDTKYILKIKQIENTFDTTYIKFKNLSSYSMEKGGHSEIVKDIEEDIDSVEASYKELEDFDKDIEK